MSDFTATHELEAPRVPLIALRDLLPYAVFFAVVATMALYFVSAPPMISCWIWVVPS